MRYKKFIKSLIQLTGFDLVRHVEDLKNPIDILPLIIKTHMATNRPFYLVQVGANDGILDDPIRDLILQYNLPGLMIEPLPDMFEKLVKNYIDQPQLIFENIAILEEAGTLPLYRLKINANVARHWHGIASFSKNNLISQGVSPEDITLEEVEGVTLVSLVKKHNISDITLLQIDTEGYDYDVIRCAFQSGIRPDIINYEHCWLVPKIRNNCKRLLIKENYRFLEIGKDTIAIKDSYYRSLLLENT